MEIIFLLTSIIITIISIYLIGRLLYTRKGLIRAYKTSEDLVMLHSVLGLTLICVIFMTLCAFNNTFWHLPYLNAK